MALSRRGVDEGQRYAAAVEYLQALLEFAGAVDVSTAGSVWVRRRRQFDTVPAVGLDEPHDVPSCIAAMASDASVLLPLPPFCVTKRWCAWRAPFMGRADRGDARSNGPRISADASAAGCAQVRRRLIGETRKRRRWNFGGSGYSC